MGSGAASKPSALKAVREAKTQSQGAKYCKYRSAMLGLSRRDSIDGTTDSVWLISTGSIVINYKRTSCVYNAFLFFSGIHSFQGQHSFFVTPFALLPSPEPICFQRLLLTCCSGRLTCTPSNRFGLSRSTFAMPMTISALVMLNGTGLDCHAPTIRQTAAHRVSLLL